MHASLWCALAYFIKSSALVMGLALFVWFFVRIILTKLLSGGRIRESLDPRVFSVLVIFPLFVILDKVHGESYQLFWSKDRVFFMSGILFPTLSVMLVLCALLMVYVFIKRSIFEWFKRDIDRLHLAVFMIIFIYGFCVSFFLYPLPLGRYATGIILPMVCLLGLLFFLSLGRRSVLIAVALIVFGCLNQYGALLPSLPPYVSRSGEHLERSREFLLDLAANKRVCHELEEHHFNDIIVVKRPFVRMLTMPEMGYVRKALPNIYAVGNPPVLISVKAFDPDLHKDPRTLYLYSPNVFEYYTRPRLLPSENDIVVFMDTTIGAPLVVYRREVESQTLRHRPTHKDSDTQASLERH